MWHEACSARVQVMTMIKLTWLHRIQAYCVSREGGRVIGFVRCRSPLPFRQVVELV